MEVSLYIYDLSRGLARTMSAALLGTQIDAIYHTSIILQGVEYVYDGGIKMVQPGMTHLGPPMQKKSLGHTSLPIDIIMDYLESMKEIYTAEAYDLWRHNCNNFSNDFATFLLGKGIPEHITNLPQVVLDSPFGRMLQPAMDDMIKNSRQRKYGVLGIQDEMSAKSVPETSHQHAAAVKKPTTAKDLEDMLQESKDKCAVIFFTSESCGPCRVLYPLYDEVAAGAVYRGTFIKVDIGRSRDIALKYSIRATPTFITFLKGEQENRWSHSEPSTLRGNIQLLLAMASPPHPHQSLRLPSLSGSSTRPVLYTKVPPLDKLLLKMGDTAKDPAVQDVKHFIALRSAEGAAEATLPGLDAFSWFLRDSVQKLTPDVMFAVVDLLRVALADSRFSGYFAEEKDHKTISSLLDYVNKLQSCPYSLRLVALQAACNLFSSPLYIEHILCCRALTLPIVQLITTSLLDDKHHNVRVAAASLSFNIATANSRLRLVEHREALPEGEQVELAACLLDALNAEEESVEALKGFLLAFGYLTYCVPKDSELVDLLKCTDAEQTVLGKTKLFPEEPLILEVGKELLGKGL